MGRIRILPEVLSNKIAAGEVVERPGSIVKELVENALDAGAGRIRVEAENGGRSLLRVSDDGSGMDRDDALLAIERHATSKISTTEDLFSIRTLGFRGEALPSIASVSRFSLVTRLAGADVGTEITIEGGKLLNVVETGAPAGTMVTVRDLFFNTPARRKFLKTVGTELGHIGDILARLALSRPDVDFEWRHNGRIVKRWPAVKDPLERAADVLGRGLLESFLPIDLETDGMQVSGWAVSSRITRPTSRGIHLFVNGRYVKDRVLQSAVFHGYRERLMKGQFPVIICRVAVPIDQVDVNVHPTKHEVRFVNPRKVRAVVSAAVTAALQAEDRPGWSVSADRPAAGETIRERIPGFAPGRPMRQGDLALPGYRTVRREPFSLQEAVASPNTMDTRDAEPGFSGHAPARPEAGPEPADGVDAPHGAIRFSDLRVIGQYRRTYLLCESDRSLILIDQHAAHERVYYEQLRNRSATANAAAQRLVIPETVETGFGECALLERLRPELGRLGLDVEPFGGNTVIVSAVPTLLSGGNVEPVIREILEKLTENPEADPPGLLDECLKIMACHGAVRARQHLDDREIRRLLVQLDECGNPSHCPHGRPTWIEWPHRDLERRFGRTGASSREP